MEVYVIVFPILEEQNRQNNSLLKIIIITSFRLLSVTRSWKAQPGSYPTTYIQVLFVRHSGVGQKFQPGHPAPFLSVGTKGQRLEGSAEYSWKLLGSLFSKEGIEQWSGLCSFTYLTLQKFLLWRSSEKTSLGIRGNQISEASLWLLQKRYSVASHCLSIFPPSTFNRVWRISW